MRSSVAVVLAAGEGKRMKSALPKVMHPIAGKPMLFHVLDSVGGAVDRVAVVVSPSTREAIAKAVGARRPDAAIAVQEKQRGTGDAVMAARAEFAGADDVIVVFGDTPFLSADVVERIREELAAGAAVVVGGMYPESPKGYGRILIRDGQVVAIREERDASEAERAVTFCNGGVMGLAGDEAGAILDAISDDNDQGEIYLTDAVEIAHARGLKVAAIEMPATDAFGVNDRAQLAAAEAAFQARRRAELMAAGVSFVAPETVFLSDDTAIGPDVTIEPNVVFGPGVTVEAGVTIRAFCHFEGARIASGATVGPYARLRPGAAIGEGAHIGNFVEIKQADVEAGAKVNHLSYIGDARVGTKANIGAGTITCNYDGFLKYRTNIGARAFVGSNSALVAPVTIGDDAYIGSGSVITKDVPDGALALERFQQVEKPGWVARFRERMAAKKKAG